MKKIVACGFLAMTVGCIGWSENPTRHYEVFVDPTFSDDQANTIVEAVMEWQISTGSWITFSGTTVDTGEDTISFYAVSDEAQLMSKCSEGAVGCEFDDGVKSHIYMPANVSDMVFFKQIAGHEAGHSLGMPHIGKNNLLCAERSCAALTVQCGDIIELAKVWDNGFDPMSLPICQAH